MILPYSRYRSGFTGRRKKRIKRLLLFLAAITATAAVVVIIIVNPFSKKSPSEPAEEIKEVNVDLFSLWENQQYTDLNVECENILNLDPLDYDTLVLNGFAYFYRGYIKYSPDEQIPLFDETIKNLRKAELLGDTTGGKLDYILGKAYFYKGRYYTDSVIEYLNRALERGFTADDLYEYLGFAYSSIGWYEKSIDAFLHSLDSSFSDYILSAIGETYRKMGDNESAERYFIRSIDVTENMTLKNDVRLKLGVLYLESKDYENAARQFKEILNNNDNNTDAHVYLGDVYAALKDLVAARAEWRKAKQIDPSHAGAIQRLLQ